MRWDCGFKFAIEGGRAKPNPELDDEENYNVRLPPVDRRINASGVGVVATVRDSNICPPAELFSAHSERTIRPGSSLGQSRKDIEGIYPISYR